MVMSHVRLPERETLRRLTKSKFVLACYRVGRLVAEQRVEDQGRLADTQGRGRCTVGLWNTRCWSLPLADKRLRMPRMFMGGALCSYFLRCLGSGGCGGRAGWSVVNTLKVSQGYERLLVSG